MSPLKEDGSVNVWLDRWKEPSEDGPESCDGYVSIDTDLNIQVVTVEDLTKLKEAYAERIAKLSQVVTSIDNAIVDVNWYGVI